MSKNKNLFLKLSKYTLENKNLFKWKIISNKMNKWFEIFFGLILLIGVILVSWFSLDWWGSFWNFRHAAWEFFKGGLVWMIALIVLLFIMLGISDLKG